MKVLYYSSLVAAALFSSASASTSAFPFTWNDFQRTHGGNMNTLFQFFKKQLGKEYSSPLLEQEHFELFTTRVKGIFDWNEAGKPYRKGINKFTDMTADERKFYVMPETKADQHRDVKIHDSKKGTPKTKALVGTENAEVCDMRPFTTSVKDQANCGSCWSFGTSAAAEASHFLWSMTDSNGVFTATNNDAWQVSEQIFVDCCDSCNGCGGGGTFQPMECAVRIGGLPSTISHPYKATDNSTCAYSASEASVNVEAWYQPCKSGDEACIKSYIGGDSCTTFATTAWKTSIEVIDSFYDYADGVYSDPNCPNDIHNHAVAIVGWGTDDKGTDYWILRNSWGTEWGQDGYFFMERGVNMCCVSCDNLFFQ